MRAFVYTRQSLDRTGEGAAVARQREACLRLCSERGWEVAREFSDNDTSASSAKPRPQYVDMLAAVERGDAEVIVAWQVDRLTRKLTELEDLIQLGERTGVRIATVGGDVDLSTDAGRLVGRILASVAKGEIERKGTRQKAAQQQAADQGKPAGGRRAFGYARDGMTIVEAEARHVRAAYADVLTGASLKGIAKRWNLAGLTTTACRRTRDHSTHECDGDPCGKRTDHTRHDCGGNPWRHDNVRGVLLNPRNAGLRAYRGEIVGPAVWPALVDAETFEAVVALLSLPGRRTTATTARKWLLPGIALCYRCGSDVATGHTRHGKRVYVCRAHKCISRKAEPVDEWVEAVVVARLSRPDAAELLTDKGPEVAGLHAKADAIAARLDDLATGLEEGVLTLAAVRRSSERLRGELAKVDARIVEASRADVLATVVTATDPGKAWVGLDLPRKREAIEALMTITLHPPERGHQPFDSSTVVIDPRR